jgi:hypothetical protein
MHTDVAALREHLAARERTIADLVRERDAAHAECARWLARAEAAVNGLLGRKT